MARIDLREIEEWLRENIGNDSITFKAGSPSDCVVAQYVQHLLKDTLCPDVHHRIKSFAHATHDYVYELPPSCRYIETCALAFHSDIVAEFIDYLDRSCQGGTITIEEALSLVELVINNRTIYIPMRRCSSVVELSALASD